MKFTIGFAARLASLLLAAHVQASQPRDITFDDMADETDGDILLQALADTGQ